MNNLACKPWRTPKRTIVTSLAAVLLMAATSPIAPAAHALNGGVKADLRLDSAVTTVDQVQAGQALKLMMKIRNAGRGKAPSSIASASLSGSAIGRQKVTALKPGQKTKVSVAVLVPSTTPAGTYKLRVCLDEKKKVKEQNEKNNCGFVSIRVTTPVPPPPVDPFDGPVSGRLSGTFNLADSGLTVSGTSTRTWQNSATVNVEMNIAPDASGREIYTDAGSIYTIDVDDKTERTQGACFFSDRQTGTGHNTFVDSPDANADEIGGHLGRTNHSEVDLFFFLHYDSTTVRKSSGPADACSNTTATTQARALDSVTVEFHEISRTATTITYAPTELTGELSTPSHWQHAAGTLTLTRN